MSKWTQTFRMNSEYISEYIENNLNGLRNHPSSKTPESDFEDIGSLDGLFAVQS